MIAAYLIAASPDIHRDLELRLESSDVEIVGSASDVEMAAEELPEREPDVALVHVDSDLREALLQSVEETRLGQELPIVFLANFNSASFVQRAMRSGVKGILLPEVSADSLESALKAVIKGLVVLSPSEASMLQTAMPLSPETQESIESLTPREKEVLQRIAGGLGNKEIAARLKISEHTVKFHVAAILGKLGAASRTEAVSIGMRRGLILL